MAESKWYCDACGARIDKRDVAAVRADGLDVDDVRAVLDAYGMQANRRWQGEIVKAGNAARNRLLARLADAER